MRALKAAKFGLAILTTLLASACAGGGGGPVNVLPPPPPAVSPPAAPPNPLPPVSGAVLAGPFAALLSTGSIAPGNGGAGNQVTVQDADAPNATAFGDLVIDGDENFRIQAAGAPGLDLTLRSLSPAVSATSVYAAERSPVMRGYSGAGFSGELGQLRVSETPLSGIVLGNEPVTYSKQFRVIRFGISGPTTNTVSLGEPTEFGNFLFGAPISSLPTSGSAAYQGAATGYYFAGGNPGRAWSGLAEIDISFAATSNGVRGAIRDSYVLPLASTGTTSLTRLFGDIGFVANLTSTGAFASTQARTTSGALALTGNVTGQLFGNGTSTEVGGALNLTGAGGERLIGAFGAGYRADVGSTNSLFLSQTMRPTYFRSVSGMGAGAANINVNNNDILGAPAGDTLTSSPGLLSTGDETFELNYLDGATSIIDSVAQNGFLGVRMGDASSSTIIAPGDTRFHDAWSTANGGVLRRYNLGVETKGARRGIFFRPLVGQIYEHANAATNPTERIFFAAGLRFPSGQRPTSGQARYSGQSVGFVNYVGASQAYRVYGSTVIDVNFAGGPNSVRGAISNHAHYDLQTGNSATAGQITDIQFTGALDASRFTATSITGAVFAPPLGTGSVGTAFTGTVAGEFFGSVAEGPFELGGGFAVNAGTVATYSGAFITGRNPLVGEPAQAGLRTYTQTSGAQLFALDATGSTGLSFSWARGNPSVQDDTGSFTATKGGVSFGATIPRSGALPFQLLNGRKLLVSNLSPFTSSLEITDATTRAFPKMVFDYTALGQWNDTNAAAPETTFVFGDRATAMPTTGTARYVGESVIRYRSPTQTGIADAEFIANANFATSAISGASRSTSPQSSSGMPDMNFTFSGTVAGTGFSGSFANTDSTLGGPISGVFAGPGAPELAGVFNATTAPSGVSFQGGFISKRE
jgi:hypothetical protein